MTWKSTVTAAVAGSAMKRGVFIVIAMLALAAPAPAQSADAARGERMYRACVACHSLEPNRNMTGPSLAEVWNRKAGSLASFPRYSPALKSSGIVWTDDTLDAWIADPRHFIPGNTMTFPGMKDARQRADLLAFLKEATRPGRAPKAAPGGDQIGGMMMGAGQVPNLKTLEPEDRVQSISHCGDSYKVATADGNTRDFWERNLRFKTDVSDDGPQKGAPALVPAGMMGDRADVIFASPEEISAFIAQRC
jgi:cytochrome c